MVSKCRAHINNCIIQAEIEKKVEKKKRGGEKKRESD